MTGEAHALLIAWGMAGGICGIAAAVMWVARWLEGRSRR
jgi:hypothetical protein